MESRSWYIVFIISFCFQQCNEKFKFCVFCFIDLQKLDVFEKLEAKFKVTSETFNGSMVF